MLRVNIADTPSKQERGLMFVKQLPHDYGMVFKFPQPKKLSFCGVNTYIPLDIAFVDSEHKIVDIKEIHPLDQRSVGCDKDCLMAIEANIDYFKDNNIAVGDKVDIVNDIMDGPCVKFSTFKKIAQKSYTEEITIEDAEEIVLPIDDFTIDEYEQEPYLERNYDDDGENYDGFQEIEDTNQQDEIMSEFDLPEITPDDLEFADDFNEEMEFLSKLEDDPYMEIDKDDETPEQPARDFPSFSSPISAMQWAKETKQTVWIDYDTKSGKNIQRNIEPHGIYKAGTGNDVLVAFDETVNDIRAFIVNKIKDFQFLDRTFNDKFVFTPN